MLFVKDKTGGGSDFNVQLQQWVLPEKRGRKRRVQFDVKEGDLSPVPSSHTSEDHLKISLLDEKGQLQLPSEEGNKCAFDGSFDGEDGADKRENEIESPTRQ